VKAEKLVTLKTVSSCLSTAGLFIVAITLIACVLPAAAATGGYIHHNTPSYVASAKNLGTEDPTKEIEVSIWLNLHNRAEFDALAKSLYDRNSPNYRHFLKPSEVSARFGPTTEEAKTVRNFFESHNLKIVTVGAGNLFVRARGTVADVQNAFHVTLNRYQVGSKVIRSNDRDPYIDDDAAAVTASVSGLDSGEYTHPIMQKGANLPSSSSKLTPSLTPSSFFTSTCFGSETIKYSTNGDGSLPAGTYKGNQLLLTSLTSDGCGYTPGPIQTAYGLTGLYTEGYNGAGQTIAIIDWCGTPTIQSDANAFSKKFGLPELTSSNFQIIYTPTVSTCGAEDDPEINLDVEWSHAVAPGANIDLVVPPSSSFQDVNQAVYYAVNYQLGNVVSGSYGSIESFTAASELDNENLVSEIAAVTGISTNFATGDDGDDTVYGIPATVSAPADSPWATGVGGVSLALNSDNSIAWQAGWGNNETLIAELGEVFDPPLAFGFYAGAGGGASGFFPSPSFQSSLGSSWRQLPDVSWLADPFTGAVIAITIPGTEPSPSWQVYGGTSLATPMFSALWAIANQEAGEPLGQAAPYLYSLPSGTIYDIVPVGSKTNVTASIKEPTTTNKYTPSEVMGGATPNQFVSALWNYIYYDDTGLVISFGTDCGTVVSYYTACNTSSALHTNKGWDNVTGVGVPNGQAFADSFAPAVKKQ
jgi:subtilase family serine protease